MTGFGGQSPLLQQFWYVYILKCSNGMIYTGCTNNLEDRIKRHNTGEVIATKNNLPVEIITFIAFTDKYKAYNFEKYLNWDQEVLFQKDICIEDYNFLKQGLQSSLYISALAASRLLELKMPTGQFSLRSVRFESRWAAQ